MAAEPLARLTTIYFCYSSGFNDALSNSFVCKRPLIYGDQEFVTTGHLYQYMKYGYPGAPRVSRKYAEHIRKASTPDKARLIAHKTTAPRLYAWQRAIAPLVKRYKERGVERRYDWAEVKHAQMLSCLRLKFTQDRHCRKMLLATGNAMLVEETRYHDEYWGRGMHGKGRNVFGHLLCQVRAELREQPRADLKMFVREYKAKRARLKRAAKRKQRAKRQKE